MMQVGKVRMSVQHRSMPMTMNVTPNDGPVSVIAVMAVVVNMVMLVFHQRVRVVVCVIAPQHEAHTDQGDHEREHLPAVYRLAQQQPRCHRADKRGGGEHQLTPSSAEFTRSSDPQRDRRSIPDAADQQRGQAGPTRWAAAEHQPDEEIRSPCDRSFDEGDVHRCEFVEPCRHSVVERPKQTGTGDDERAPSQPGVI